MFISKNQSVECRRLAKTHKMALAVVIELAEDFFHEQSSIHGEPLDLTDVVRNTLFWSTVERDVLLKQANLCNLTKLSTRRSGEKVLSTRIEALSKHNTNPSRCRPLSLIYIDLDHFKEINDTYGHPTGDEVLKKVGSVIIQHSRKDDYSIRWGGEELLLIVDGNLETAIKIAERIRNDVSKLNFKHDKVKFNVTISCGVSSYKPSDFPADAKSLLINEADKALYKAKQTGRNRVVTHSTL
jgi:diguanylate cyclase (GGDEF)-like protein